MTQPRSSVRLFQTAFLVVSLGAVALVHSPWLPTPIQGLGHGVSNVLGQEVRWSMFASDPRGFWATARADVEYEDGTTLVWDFGPRDDGSSYRELKWLESEAFEGAAGFEELGAWLSAEPSVSRVRIWVGRHQVADPAESAVEPVSELVYESTGSDR